MRCEFVDSMAAESRSVQSDESATSADSDPCETDKPWSSIEASVNRIRCQSISDGRLFLPPTRYRRVPSNLRTTVVQHRRPHVGRERGPSPGLNVVNNTRPSRLAGTFARYMRVTVPVAHKVEWRRTSSEQRAARSEQRAKQRKPPTSRTRALRVPRLPAPVAFG